MQVMQRKTSLSQEQGFAGSNPALHTIYTSDATGRHLRLRTGVLRVRVPPCVPVSAMSAQAQLKQKSVIATARMSRTFNRFFIPHPFPLQFIDQDCFPSDNSLRLAEKISGASYSALYFVPLPVPSTVIYPFCTSLFRIVTVFDLPNPVASTMAELGISLFFSS